MSECGLYRFRLARTWDEEERPACFIMLNPSTADARKDDPTIRRCISYARSWNAGGIVVVNLFAFRATDPKELLKAADPVGPGNDLHIRKAVERCHPVVCAWGTKGALLGRGEAVKRLLAEVGVAVKCLAVTKDGHPNHPLYLANGLALLPFTVTSGQV